MTVIARVDTAPHRVETPTQGTPLLIGVREASGPQPMGVKSSASSLTVIKYGTTTCFFYHGVVVRSTWISLYDLRLTQPNKKKYARVFVRLYFLCII